jgi:quercetin dioxygenase-like cupin family protein
MSPVRLVVTGDDRSGRSNIHSDGNAQRSFDVGVGEMHQLWLTENVPVDATADALAAQPHEVIAQPRADGTLFEICTFRPGQRSPFHRTATIDYVYVVQGEIHLGVDDGEVLLRAGDTVVQRATTHYWDNRSDEPCTMCVVMVSTSDDPEGSTDIELR